jgi:PEP-CTERM motif
MKQNHFHAKWRECTIAGALAFVLVSSHAQAAPLELIYNGSFNDMDALNLASQLTPVSFTGNTPFTIRAWFDSSSPNLAPPSPPAPPPFAGFRAYSPSVVTIDIAGQTFTMDNFTTNPTAGVTVAIFDQNSFTPGRYAIGILQQPPQDGAGIIGDFSGASPAFTANALTATTFTGYNGVGYGSGVCLQGTGGNCQVNAITPFVLHDATNQTWALTLGNYEEVYPGGSDPVSAGIPGPLNQAQLVATPEPGTLGVMGAALVALFGLRRRRLS